MECEESRKLEEILCHLKIPKRTEEGNKLKEHNKVKAILGIEGRDMKNVFVFLKKDIQNLSLLHLFFLIFM